MRKYKKRKGENAIRTIKKSGGDLTRKEKKENEKRNEGKINGLTDNRHRNKNSELTIDSWLSNV